MTRARGHRTWPAVVAALVITVAWLGGSASARAANQAPLSCSPSSVAFGTTRRARPSARRARRSRFRALPRAVCRLRPALSPRRRRPARSSTRRRMLRRGARFHYSANGYSSGASTVVRGIGTNVFSCTNSTIVFGQPASCSATPATPPDTIDFGTQTGTVGTFTQPSCLRSSGCSTSYQPGNGTSPQELTAFSP